MNSEPTLTGSAGTHLLGGALILWRPRPLLTFGEQVLFSAASSDGFRGLQFQSRLIQRAVIRSFGVPSLLLGGDCNYSSWRSHG